MTELLWNSLLNLHHAICNSSASVDFAAIQSDGSVLLNQLTDSAIVIITVSEVEPNLSGKEAVFRLRGKTTIECVKQGKLTVIDRDSFICYLPYCFLPLLAKQKKRAISVAHFAQTLDGKIATKTGDSKWIGNDQNLIHAHRMRALSCSILVGRNTVLEDKPSLTVRHVKGKNPKKIVISSSPCDMSSLLSDEQEGIIVFGKTDQPEMKGLDYHKLASQNGHINCNTILEAMYEKGIHSVYVEGGAITTSNFLKDNAIDILQLHISPMVFGSGQSAIELPGIDKVNEAIQFTKFQFQRVGDTIMFVGELNTNQ